MTIQRFDPENQGAVRGWVHAIKAGGFVFIAGQGGHRPDGAIAPDFIGQANQTFENLKSALALAGATLDQVVKMTVFVKDEKDMDAYRAVRARHMKTPHHPTSSMIAAKALAFPELLIAIEVWAYTG
jgi:2-iminobutanoate/2-iminopropanoate deaminase